MKKIRTILSLLLVIVFCVFISNWEDSSQAAAGLSRDYVSVSGESFGIKMHTQGILVISTAQVQTDAGAKNPAGDVGMRAGDVITMLNGEAVSDCAAVSEVIEQSEGEQVIITFRRGEQEKSVGLQPALCSATGTYKAGLWIRDSSAGIGTVTFYDKSGNFGALGHGVTDVDTQMLLPLSDGEAVQSEIIGFSQAQKGTAGELYGLLTQTGIGSITKNTEGGVYGKAGAARAEREYIPVAQPKEIKRGKATLLTTIDGSGIQQFDISIQFINKLGSHYKDMVVKVTDERLLKATGGILQGMSGSPILQNGKFVGALTHVFLNRPELGYAVFGYKMVSLAKQ